MATDLKHQTRLQFARELRRRLRDASGLESCRIAAKIISFLADGTITTANCQNAWNMTAPEWAARLVILQAKADKWAAFKAARDATVNEQGA